MSENKTRPTDADVMGFLNAVEPEKKRDDALVLLELMEEVTGEQATMWGTSIVGFGSYHYKYDSGREGDMPLVGYSPRKQNLTLYIMPGFDAYDDLLNQLGKHSTGKSCLYIKKVEDVDMEVLRELVTQSYQHMKESNNLRYRLICQAIKTHFCWNWGSNGF
jgi:hypothetical protein